MVVLWEGHSWHSLGPLILTEPPSNATVYLAIADERVHPLMDFLPAAT